MSSTTPAGWYPDPEREGATRWWDGAQWAPSQEPAAGDDRFRPRDESEQATDAGADAGAQDAGAAWGQQGAEPTWQQSTPAWDAQANPAASAPAWQQETPSWQQPAQAWGQGDQAQQAYGQQGGQTGVQSWNQQVGQPKKSRTGLIIGIAAGALVLLLLVVGGLIWAVTSFIGAASPTQTTDPIPVTGDSFTVTVPANGQSYSDIDIDTAGLYQIDVVSTNSEDPRIELTGNGVSYSDDDGGDEPLASRITEYLEPGTYQLMVEEYGGDPLVATVTVSQG